MTYGSESVQQRVLLPIKYGWVLDQWRLVLSMTQLGVHLLEVKLPEDFDLNLG